jgi:hypothetical protein
MDGERRRRPQDVRRLVRHLTEEAAMLPVSDGRSLEVILGYDDAGLPS